MKTASGEARRPLAAVAVAAVGFGTALTGTLVSACCVTPALATLTVTVLGAGGAASAAGLKPYASYLFIASLVILVWAFWMVYRPATANCASGECRVRTGRTVRLMLWPPLRLGS